MFERAVIHARNEGVDLLFIHALSENTAMLKIARRAGMQRRAAVPRARRAGFEIKPVIVRVLAAAMGPDGCDCIA